MDRRGGVARKRVWIMTLTVSLCAALALTGALWMSGGLRAEEREARSAEAARAEVAAALASLDAVIARGTTVRWSELQTATSETPPTTLVAKWTRDLNATARQRLAETAALAEQRARERLGLRILAPQTDLEGGVRWERMSPELRGPERVVLLVHGLDEPGEIWDSLAPLLRSKGYRVARLDYPNDQAIAHSADALLAALRALAAAGTERVDIVGHSMGGLVARDALTRPEFVDGEDGFPDVERLILVGTPNHGAPLAPMRMALEVREQALRWMGDGALVDALTGFFAEGCGAAGTDLTPGSAFLTDLNARPLPSGVRITQILGNASPVDQQDVLGMLDSPLGRALFAQDDAAAVAAQAREWMGAVGDGVVPRSSALLEGVDDVVELNANHRGLLRAAPAPGREASPGVEAILDRLERTVEQPVGGV